MKHSFLEVFILYLMVIEKIYNTPQYESKYMKKK